MNYRVYLILAIVLFVGCSRSRKSANDGSGVVSVHKVWQFDTVKVSSQQPVPYIPHNSLDLTATDTLKFSYQTKKENHNLTSYPYKIMHDTVYVNHNPAYKILKLTAGELDMLNIFKNENAAKKSLIDSVIMIYKAN